MKISIRQPLAFTQQGRKDNQEDALYPDRNTVTTRQRIFLMCDGMGGHEHGEVASNTVTKAMGEILDASDNPRADFDLALQHAYDELDAKDTSESEKKMGTTMTCLILDNQGAVIAHIGDSRVYQIRPSEYNAENGRLCIKQKTRDHSLVNDLLRAGELTEEEARNYPHKNIITRAMQPHQDRRSKAEMDIQEDIQSGDYFFLCCDGVLEQLTDQRLCEILATPKISDQEKIDRIQAECDGKTRDNYTCWLVPIDKVEKDESDRNKVNDEDIIVAESAEETTSPEAQPEPQEIVATESDSFRKWMIFIAAVIVLAACLAFGYWYYIKLRKP